MKGKVTKEQKKIYFETVDANIVAFGFHVTNVMEDAETTPFGYSTGIYKNLRIPELFISGLPPGLTQEIITAYAKKYQFNAVPINQKIDDLIGRFPVYLISVKNENLSEYVLSSIRYYADIEYKYLQLIFPDLDGRFPGEEGYNYDQEIFGEMITLL